MIKDLSCHDLCPEPSCSSRQFSRSTLPTLAKVFSRPVTGVLVPTYGLLFDLAALVLQRSLSLHTSTQHVLYQELRSALTNTSTRRVVLLAHNAGAVLASQAISELYADLPADRIAKLEVYTFGAGAYQFLAPVGETRQDQQQQQYPQNQQADTERKSIHIEHFALATDPFAQFGVLRSVRRHLDHRFCGGVFVISGQVQPRILGRLGPLPPRSGLVLTDYLSALFPRQMPGAESEDSVLDTLLNIDRALAEKREFAAMSNHAMSHKTKGEKKRLSWTGLGATVGHPSGVRDGILGLEMARRDCADCEGHMASEISWLARYVAEGWEDDRN